ncbi:MAG: DUF6788 family protein [Thermodesulfovibrionales bacterium]
MSKKERVLKEILACSEMLQGSIVRIKARCGKKGCKCERGQPHGISHYLSFRESGKTQMVYIPKEKVKEVLRRINLFKRYWELGIKLSRLNLEELKRAKGSRR